MNNFLLQTEIDNIEEEIENEKKSIKFYLDLNTEKDKFLNKLLNIKLESNNQEFNIINLNNVEIKKINEDELSKKSIYLNYNYNYNSLDFYVKSKNSDFEKYYHLISQYYLTYIKLKRIQFLYEKKELSFPNNLKHKIDKLQISIQKLKTVSYDNEPIIGDEYIKIKLNEEIIFSPNNIKFGNNEYYVNKFQDLKMIGSIIFYYISKLYSLIKIDNNIKLNSESKVLKNNTVILDIEQYYIYFYKISNQDQNVNKFNYNPYFNSGITENKNSKNVKHNTCIEADKNYYFNNINEINKKYNTYTLEKIKSKVETDTNKILSYYYLIEKEIFDKKNYDNELDTKPGEINIKIIFYRIRNNEMEYDKETKEKITSIFLLFYRCISCQSIFTDIAFIHNSSINFNSQRKYYLVLKKDNNLNRYKLKVYTIYYKTEDEYVKDIIYEIIKEKKIDIDLIDNVEDIKEDLIEKIKKDDNIINKNKYIQNLDNSYLNIEKYLLIKREEKTYIKYPVGFINMKECDLHDGTITLSNEFFYYNKKDIELFNKRANEIMKEYFSEKDDEYKFKNLIYNI